MSGRAELEAAIAAQERLRGLVPDAVIDAAVDALRDRLDSATPPVRAERQRKQVTVLFADVSGFTAMSSAMDAEDVGDAFDALWDRIDRAITDADGRIDKHIGDAVMAVWGADMSREDDPQRAIMAALAIQEAVAGLAAPLVDGAAALRVRIGINTGPVLLGDVGTTSEYTAIGDTVNVASRLERAAPVGGVLIGHDTYRHVRGIFSVDPQPPLQVKGKDDPLITYVVNGVLPRPFRLPTRGLEGVETRMVGRDAELGALRDLMEGAMEGRRTRLVTVVGEAGIGKSRLLYEFEDWLRLQPRSVWLFKGRADQQREVVPYALIRDVVFSRFEITDNDAGSVALAKLEAGFSQFLGPTGGERASLLGHLVGLDVRSSHYLADILDDPRQLRDRAFGAAADLLRAMTDEMGAVMLLEDVHWSDQGSLDLVEHLIVACRDAPLTIVALARPTLFEHRPAWGHLDPLSTRLELRPLAEDASRMLVGELLKRAPELPETVRATIVDTAEGNPFYVEEIVKSLIEEGAVDTAGDEWRISAERLGALGVPATLTGLLQARLDRLTRSERAAIQRASVVGRVFWDQAVITASDADPGAPVDAREAEVERALAALEARELVFERYGSAFAGSREFIFKHALLRDVTYESVLKRMRRKYHRAVADWLAAQPEAESRAAMIARHYEDGEEHRKCAAWYAIAGTQARLRYANKDAVAYYRRALDREELLPAQQVPVYDGLGEVLMLQAEYDAALEAWLSMRAAAEAAGDVRSQARALAGMAFVHGRLGATRDALEAAEAAEALLLGLPDPAAGDLADALLAAGWASFRLGDLPDAQRRAEEARVLAAEAGDRRGVSRGLNLLSLVESMRGDHAAAVAHMEEGLAIDRERADRRAEGASLINLGETARMLGDYEHAAARYGEALVIQRELGDRDMEALSLSNLGGAQLGLGEYEEALQKLEPALEAFEGAGASENLSETYRFLAEAHLGLGDPNTAIGFGQRALATAVAAGNPEQTGHAWRVIGLIAGRTGRGVASEAGGPASVEAADAFGHSVATFEDAALDRDRAVALADWAVWERTVGEPHAGERMQEARDVLAGLGLGRLEAHIAAAFDAADRVEC